MMERIDPVRMDIPEKDSVNSASIQHLIIPSCGEKLLATFFSAQGKGPHPTAVILHGFPGHDRNLDIAHMLRRGGLNSLVFHYRGSWGSGGYIDFSNILEDTGNVIDHVRRNSGELKTDPDTIVLVGHSMGGWGAFMTAASDERIRLICGISTFNLGVVHRLMDVDEHAMNMVAQTLGDLVIPLRTRSVDHLMDQIVKHGQEWDLLRYAERFRGRSVLLVGSANDLLSIPEFHLEPMKRKFRSVKDCDLLVHISDTDHSHSDARIELQDVLWGWVSKRI